MERDEPGGGRGTATQTLINLEFRSSDQFGPNYDRMGIEALMQIAAAYDNVELYIKLNILDRNCFSQHFMGTKTTASSVRT